MDVLPKSLQRQFPLFLSEALFFFLSLFWFLGLLLPNRGRESEWQRSEKAVGLVCNKGVFGVSERVRRIPSPIYKGVREKNNFFKLN